jgi:polysaccharide pyruvyl transferase WcaK-like protein
MSLMAAARSKKRIGVFSHGGLKNLGDEALLAAVIQNTRLRLPDAEIIGFTINPPDTVARHGISCFPIRRLENFSSPTQAQEAQQTPAPPSASKDSVPVRGLRHFLKSIPGFRPAIIGLRKLGTVLLAVACEPTFLFDSYRRLKGVDLLLLAGGQQLNDIYGTWSFPYTLFKWMVLARWTGTKVALLSVGAGPINGPISRIFIKRVVNMVAYRSYRDSISADLVRSLGVKGDHPVLPDLVYSLQLPTPKSLHAAEHCVVGTNPVPFYDGRYWAAPDPARYQDYVQKLARFSVWLDHTGHSILFFPTQARADVFTIDDIRRQMNGSGNSPRILECRPIQNLEDLVSEINRTDIVIANRYHGILISLMMNKPVLGIAYHEKSRALLAQAGLGDYVLNISHFKTEDLIEKFRALESNAPALKKVMTERLAPLRKALDDQYDIVFGLVGVKSQPPPRLE